MHIWLLLPYSVKFLRVELFKGENFRELVTSNVFTF